MADRPTILEKIELTPAMIDAGGKVLYRFQAIGTVDRLKSCWAVTSATRAFTSSCWALSTSSVVRCPTRASSRTPFVDSICDKESGLTQTLFR
jgi:hypothetical protein